MEEKKNRESPCGTEKEKERKEEKVFKLSPASSFFLPLPAEPAKKMLADLADAVA